MNYFIACLIGYAFGCIQASYLLGKIILKKDIRQFGNGNAGASNSTVVFGKKMGFLVGIIDILKTIISLIVLRLIFKGNVDQQMLVNMLYLNGLFVILGHNFPFYMSFKGGKGTAALVGMLLALDIRLGLVSILVMLIVTLATDYIVMGTMSLLIVLLISTLIFHAYPLTIIIVACIMGMSIYKHIPNLIKIWNGNETKVRSSLSK